MFLAGGPSALFYNGSSPIPGVFMPNPPYALVGDWWEMRCGYGGYDADGQGAVLKMKNLVTDEIHEVRKWLESVKIV